MSHPIPTQDYTQDREMRDSLREVWLSEYGRTENDVMQDAYGDDYIMLGDGFEDKVEVVLLPEHLQSTFWV